MMTQLDHLFLHHLEQKHFAGVSAVVRRRGDVVWRGNFGLRDIRRELPAENETLYRLASMTKPVVAAAIMLLSDRGALNIDDRVDKYLPSFSNMTVADRMVGFMDVYEADPQNPLMPKFNSEKLEGIQAVPLTQPLAIRHLLGHCGGMGQGPYSNSIYETGLRPDQTLAERVEWMSRVPLDFQPGEFAGYSAGMGFDVLGRIVEVVSGRDLDTFVRQELCGPLGVSDLGWRLTKEQQGRLSRLYEAKDGALIDVTETDASWKVVDPLPQDYFSGSAGMFGSLEAYDRFAQMLANGGELDGVHVLKPETVARMRVNSSPKKLEMAPGIGWGLGMIVHEDTERSGRRLSKGSFGWSGAYGCHFFIDPIRQLSAVMTMAVSNIGGADSPIAREFENAIWEQFSE